ncbi:hypothetical protein QO002_004428 [Pararhizobium capsulatum DSM 1112]|uniref:DUF3618 domain-containing protein n=1 Tax=Pararhizobium capsulatum DSM 1112 TaxID=1121113 RepID=A0ABU0BZG0_9HYPH|nr:hypothetical protein [Pararhizobium capsulatum]MDQ0322222.1 hypothetical protein [Pararhizobium capsulatum DSM 1112]
MTNIKARGFESVAQLREHMAEVDDENPRKISVAEHNEHMKQREIALLRAEVADLHERISLIREQTDAVDEPVFKQETHPWLRIIATVATTFVLGRLVQRLRLGTPGAAAVPMIAAQLDRRFW